jgi:hypothetical protein
MELTQLNNLNNLNNLNHVSDVKNSFKTNDLHNSKEVIEKYPTDTIDFQRENTSSSFLTNISTNMNKLVDLQKMQSLGSNQLEITSELVKITETAQNSRSIQLDDKQPEIKNLMDHFNILSKKINTTEISDKAGVYFDGQVGARPLSTNEIHDAVAQQRERLSQFNKKIDSQIESIVSDTKGSIELEKVKVETKVEFKKVDYAKESALFDSSTLASVQGGVIPSQANGFPLHSEKLLA